MLDFSKEYKLSHRDSNLYPSRILAIRLAHAYFVVYNKLNLDFVTFFDLCFEHINLFYIEAVFFAIRKDLNLPIGIPLYILLHIDQVQNIFEFECESASVKGIFRDIV